MMRRNSAQHATMRGLGMGSGLGMAFLWLREVGLSRLAPVTGVGGCNERPDDPRDKGTEVATIGAEATVGDAVKLLGERRIGALPVVDADGVVGIMSERDVNLLPEGPWRRSSRLADQPGDELASHYRGSIDPRAQRSCMITQRRSGTFRLCPTAVWWESCRSATW
jgi:hypothetical protein